MTEKHLKKCSRSFITRGMQVKTTLRFYLISVRMARSIKQMTAHAGEDTEEEQHLFVPDGVETVIAIIKVNGEVPQEAEN